MSLSQEQREIMSLGGTVTFPAMLPNLGWIDIDDRDGTLRIQEMIQGKRVARSVNLKDVAAVMLPDDPKNPNFNFGSWFFCPNVTRSNVNGLNGQQNPMPRLGVVFVRENAPVLIEAASVAAESENFVTSMVKYWGCN